MAASFLQNPYVFGFAIVILTSLLVYGYQYTVEPSEKSKKTLYKTLAAGSLAVLVLTYFTQPRPEQVSTEPFNAPELTA